MEIQTVTVELLRVGPRHNQLISPLTQYLGVCGNSAAGRVTLPYEHGDLEMRLQELRYSVFDRDDQARSVKVLGQTGRDVAKILSAIPGVSGNMRPEEDQSGTLTHLRIVLSASELAMLPFEATKVPSGDESVAEWLVLQARSPTCITRHIRSVSAEGIVWPNKPRILFIAGPDTPFAKHGEVLSNAIRPWCKDKESVPEQLVIMENPSLASVTKELHTAAAAGKAFTHVHILAHGAHLDEHDRYSPVGLYLNDEEGEGVIGGGRLASTLTVMIDRGVTRPVVVTVASCDSGQVSDVRTTDASVAHYLHDQGIPLVVASQFPLSVEGSVLFTERFYHGQLRGIHPLISLYKVRLELHSRMEPDTHDWASLVVYEAFPSNLASQLEDLRYWQARRALYLVLDRLDDLAIKLRDAVPTSADRNVETLFEEVVDKVEAASNDLPTKGPYALDCAGLRAAGNKRMALAAFAVATAPGVPEEWGKKQLSESLRRMEMARDGYWVAAKQFIRPSTEAVQRKGNLHWMLGQVLSLDVVLGRPLDNALLMTASFAAKIDLDSPDAIERAWAHVSLSELALLSLASSELLPDQREQYAEETLANARRFLELLGRGSEHAFNTSRQFQRYVDWWGNPKLQPMLERLGVPKRPHWHEEHGLVPTAEAVVQLLGGPPKPSSQTNSRSPDKGAAEDPVPVTPKQKKKPGVSAKSLKGRSDSAVFSIEMLPAENGDCLWIEYGDPDRPRRVLIDCGAKSAAKALGTRIKELGTSEEAKFELFVLTHIDSDHITGAIPLFADADVSGQFKDIWFNGWRQVSQFLSIRQGEEFSRLLENLPWNRAVTAKGAKYPAPIVISSDEALPTFTLPGGLSLTLLSPGAGQLKSLGRNWQKALLELEPEKALLGRKGAPPPVTDFAAFDLASLAGTKPKKDPSVPNGSSIALLLEFEGRSMLLTGDAHAHVLAKSIKSLQLARGKEGEKLKLDALKLSHHGSGNATTIELLELLDCPRYLVSSNGNIFYHPDREAIARVILHGGESPTLCFNYRSTLNGLWDEKVLKERYSYKTIYPPKESKGLRVLL
jgi:hypothetical protein